MPLMTISMKYLTRMAATLVMVFCPVSIYPNARLWIEMQTYSSLRCRNSSQFQASLVLPITVSIVGRLPFGLPSASRNSAPHPKLYAPPSFRPFYLARGIQPTNEMYQNSFTRTTRRCTIQSYLRASRGRKRAIGNRAFSFTGKTMVDSASRDQD
jgi:hypothetical protein